MFYTLKLVWCSAMLAMGVSWAAPVKLEASGETKRQSVFFPKATTDVLQANLKRNPRGSGPGSRVPGGGPGLAGKIG